MKGDLADMTTNRIETGKRLHDLRRPTIDGKRQIEIRSGPYRGRRHDRA